MKKSDINDARSQSKGKAKTTNACRHAPFVDKKMSQCAYLPKMLAKFCGKRSFY